MPQTKITKYITSKKNKGYEYYRNKRWARNRSLNRARTVMNLKRDVHFFKRSFLDGTIVGNATYAPYLQGKSIVLNSIPNVSEFQNLFDRYMITYAKVYYHLKIDPSAQTASTATLPKLYVVKDYDDDNAPTSINQLREHSKCRFYVMNPNRPVVIKLKPAISSSVYNTAITSTYSPKWKQWIDMASVVTPHYGWKIAIDDLTNTNYKVDVEVKLWFRCKDIR